MAISFTCQLTRVSPKSRIPTSAVPASSTRMFWSFASARRNAQYQYQGVDTVGQPMAVCQRGIYVEYSVEYSKRRALNGIDWCRLSTVELECRRPFWPSTPGLAQYQYQGVGECEREVEAERGQSE
eukprot:1188581-Prorocentrum_minimum.AAC.5